MDKTELRLDPLTRDWTIFNEARALPPTASGVREAALAESPFRAGLERFAAHTLHHAPGQSGWQVRVVPNRLPVLRVEGDAQAKKDGIYEHMDAVGAHELVIEDPGDRAFEDMQPADIEHVLRAWAVRIEDLTRDMRMRSFSIVKNVGLAAGQTVAHSVSQIVAMAVVPAVLRRKMRNARNHFTVEGRSIFEDIIEQERRTSLRVVHEDADFLVFCPYASRVPFEVAVWPRRQNAHYHRITAGETASLARTLRTTLRKLNRATDRAAYHFALTTAPACPPDADEVKTLGEDFRWHIAILPVLRPVDAFQMATGCHVNGVWPEVAADHLRSIPDDQG